ncbi:MAG: sulfur carrier protein ThiS [Jatrophihabitans sp.]
MIINLNGRPHEVTVGATVGELIVDVTGSERGSAAVIDGEVVPRSTWSQRALTEGASVELITAVQGG